MKDTFSLRRSAILLFVILIVIAIINVIVTIRLTFELSQYAAQSDVLSDAAVTGNDIRYEVEKIQQYLTDVSLTTDQEGYKQAEIHYQNAQKLLNELATLQPDSKPTFDTARQKLQAFYDIGKQMTNNYLIDGVTSGNYLMKRPETGFDARATDLLIYMQSFIVPLDQKNDALKKVWAEKRTQLRWYIIAAIFLSTLATIIAFVFIGRKLFNYLGAEPAEMLKVANSIASGNFNNTINLAKGDSSSLLATINVMQTNLNNNRVTANQKVQEMLRIKTALDATSMNIRIADTDGNLIYLNPALTNTLKQIQDEIRKKVPTFDANNMLGKSVGVFYDDPQAAVERLKNLRVERQSDIVIGGRQYWLITNPIFNTHGVQEGTVGQWIDKTDELRTEKEVTALVTAAAAGDLSHRIDLTDKTGFFLSLSQSVNQMVETTDGVINETVGALERIANGDMTQQIETEYQGAYERIKDNTNLTIQRLTDIVSEIKAVAHATNISATEIAAGNIDLSQRTEEQASSLEETASSMEQMASTVKQNADNARQANMLASEASQVAVKGGQVVNQVVSTMADINTSSKKIVDIISVIDGIAFQTNILALNAAVEAARAGEQGRGFAVVATEVRNLAQRSAAAAKEIKQLIGDSVDKVAGGTKLVEDAGKTMDEIVLAVKMVTDIVNEIASASQEQSAGIDQVNNAITNMDEVTQQNAALVEQAAAAAASMEQQTQDLIDSVAVFQLPEMETEIAPATLSKPTLRKLSQPQPKAIAATETKAKKASIRASSKASASAKDEDWEEF